jgi:hypothetical protein
MTDEVQQTEQRCHWTGCTDPAIYRLTVTIDGGEYPVCAEHGRVVVGWVDRGAASLVWLATGQPAA